MANIGLVGDPAWLPPAEVAPGLADLRERQVEAAEAYQAAVGRHREAGWAARREREAHEVAVREATLAGQEPPTPPATPAHTPEHLSALAA
ncbi:MAG TPA: hypothetical protein VKD47_01790, partial [Miltoncostaeaceae bacterium]|nr:hypothetical protein [Miltoncostaeaceae bacterium]